LAKRYPTALSSAMAVKLGDVHISRSQSFVSAVDLMIPRRRVRCVPRLSKIDNRDQVRLWQ